MSDRPLDVQAFDPQIVAACLYVYRCQVLRVVDGDTIVGRWDLGDGFSKTCQFRLMGVNTPESFRPKSEEERRRGIDAKQWLQAAVDAEQALRAVVDDAGWMLIRTYHDDHEDQRGKFGRVMVELLSTSGGEVVSLNHQLIREGHAVPYLLGAKSRAPQWLLDEASAFEQSGLSKFDYLDACAAEWAMDHAR